MTRARYLVLKLDKALIELALSYFNFFIVDNWSHWGANLA